MANKEVTYKLPQSSIEEVKKILIAYSKAKGAVSLSELSISTGMNKTGISANNGFLESIKAISGGNSKEPTTIGKKLGLALTNNREEEIEINLKSLLVENAFIDSMITYIGLKPRTSEDFQSHITYSLEKELKGKDKTGAITTVELMKMAGLIEEKDGFLYPAQDSTSNEPSIETGIEQIKTSSVTEQLVGNVTVGSPNTGVTLNINIQLTIPETENEQVYENFFKAMKKHLIS